MFKLSVGAMFKNESLIIKEWLDHYIYNGVEHFYLVDDNSDDNYLSIIQPYIDKGLITLFISKDWSYYLGRQRAIYNTFILPEINNTTWLLMVDLDEYAWSPKYINLTDMLDQCSNYGQIQVNATFFGSNNHITQPKSIIESFTKRTVEINNANIKYFLNTKFGFSSLNVHDATFIDDNHYDIKYFIILGKEYFRINHYSCQSFEYWKNVKCTRGDGDHYRVRTVEDFSDIDYNEEYDNDLCIHNINLINNNL